MAPKHISRIFMFPLVLALCFAGLPAPVFAASTNESLLNKVHTFKFYLDPALVSDTDFAKLVLPKYVADMNVILAKNTNRQLAFDPATGIILTNTQPHSNSAPQPLPVDQFEIWAYAVASPYPISYGGYMGVDESGAGVLAGLKWTRLYDPDRLKPDEITDYWTQINNMLHELAHVFGAGIGEYYNLSIIKDTTGALPLLDINLSDSGDAFWKDKPDFRADPLLQNPVRTPGSFSSREALLVFVQYSNLTAAVISHDYRNSAPTVDLSGIIVHVIDSHGLPIEKANVKIWSITGNSPYPSKLKFDSLTNDQGQLAFAWGDSPTTHNVYDFLRLIKVYKDGYVSSAKYVSIFDTDIEKLVKSNDQFIITITLNELDKTFTSTFTDVPVSNVALSSIEAIYSAAITNGCGLSPLIYCPTMQVTRAQMAVFLLRGIHGSSYNPPLVGNSTGFGDVAANHWAAAWIKQLAAEGISVGCGKENYCPEYAVTRDQMAVFLLRSKYGANYVPPTMAGDTGFSDIPTDYWAKDWIRQLMTEGITAGCGDGNYCPSVAVTREQMAVFLVRTFHLP
jgi:S-layer homology domain